MQKYQNDIRQIINNHHNNYRLIKKELDSYYLKIENKIDFLDYMQYDIIEKGILKIKSDLEVVFIAKNSFRTLGKERLKAYKNCKKWIKKQRENLEKNQFKNDSYSHIFKTIDNYNNFLIYRNRHIIEPYVDYSYLFQRMKFENLIHSTKHLVFIDWLHKNSSISQKWHTDFYEKGSFRSLNKSESNDRINNFNNIFKL